MKKIFFTVLLVLSVCLFARAQNADFNTNGGKFFGPSISGDYLTTAVWGTFATSPHAQSRSCCAAIKRGDTILVYQFGGGTAGSSQLNVAKYNKLTNTWTNNVATMPFNMSAGCAVTMPGDSLIYVIGGTNSPAVYGKCLKYNIITNTFTTMADMTPNACTDQLSVLYHDSLIYCVGGGDGLFGTTIQYNSVRFYNTKSNTWTTATSLPITLSMMGGGIYGDTIVVSSGASGGAYVANSYKGIINPSNPTQITWTAIAAYPGGAVTRKASYFVKVGTGGGILCTGGAVGGATLTSATYLWNFCTQSWQTLTPNTLARSNYRGCGFGDSVVYCVSGYTTVGTGQCDKITFSQIDGTCFSEPVSNTWTEQTSGLATELNSVSAVNDMVCWASGAAGKVVRTINSGSLWTNVSGDLPTTGVAYCIWGFDANNALVTTSPTGFTYIYKTTNGGTNWTQVFSQSGGFGNGFYFINATTGFFAGDHVGTRLTIFKTTNAGSTWDSTGQLFSTTADGWNNAMTGYGNQIWIGTNSTTIVYSSNAGVNWTAQTTSVANQYAIWFNSATVGMAGGPSANGTWKTTNSGTNWVVIGDSIANNCTGLCGSGSSWWQTTFLPKVYYSSNDGATWATQYTAPAGNFRHITKARTGETLWGVRSNGGISRYGALVGVTPVNTPVPSDYSLMQNYPNPFNPTTKINFALPKAGLVTLKIYNVLGQEVSTLVNEVKSAGNYSVDFDGANLSSGVYFYAIKAGDFTSVKKMTLIK